MFEKLVSGGHHAGNKSESHQPVDGMRELQTPTGQEHYSAETRRSNLRPLPWNLPKRNSDLFQLERGGSSSPLVGREAGQNNFRRLVRCINRPSNGTATRF
jgi:hypothetical protein